MKICRNMDGAVCIDAIAQPGRELDRTAPVLIVPAPARAHRTGRSNLLTEIERFVTAGQPELAAERLISAILTAGLAAMFADPSQLMPAETVPVNLGASSMLTRREREVTRLVVSGLTNRCIADELFIAQSTVERHVANIMNKLGFNSRTQIAAWAVANGLAKAA